MSGEQIEDLDNLRSITAEPILWTYAVNESIDHRQTWEQLTNEASTSEGSTEEMLGELLEYSAGRDGTYEIGVDEDTVYVRANLEAVTDRSEYLESVRNHSTQLPPDRCAVFEARTTEIDPDALLQR